MITPMSGEESTPNPSKKIMDCVVCRLIYTTTNPWFCGLTPLENQRNDGDQMGTISIV